MTPPELSSIILVLKMEQISVYIYYAFLIKELIFNKKICGLTVKVNVTTHNFYFKGYLISNFGHISRDLVKNAVPNVLAVLWKHRASLK